MDLYKAIRQLREEMERLDRVIESLEQLEKGGLPKFAAPNPPGETEKRRGRKAMSAEERRTVSERMRKYWADKRKKPKGR
jgi:hypothetical protein